MRPAALRALCCGLAVLALAAGRGLAAEIGPELWDRPRAAQVILAHPAIREAVAAYHVRDGRPLRVVHGERQEALLQAEELRAWLLALGLEPGRVSLRRDPAAAVLRLEVTEP